MTQAMTTFLLTSLTMSAVILAVLAVHALFAKALTAKTRYAVWLVILIGLIIPWRPVIGSGLIAISLPTAGYARIDGAQLLSNEQTKPEAISESDSMSDVRGGVADDAAWFPALCSPVLFAQRLFFPLRTLTRMRCGLYSGTN